MRRSGGVGRDKERTRRKKQKKKKLKEAIDYGGELSKTRLFGPGRGKKLFGRRRLNCASKIS